MRQIIHRYFSQPPTRYRWLFLPMLMFGWQLLMDSSQLHAGAPLWRKLPSLAASAMFLLLASAELLPAQWMPLVRLLRALALSLWLIGIVSIIVVGIRFYNGIFS